MENNIIHFLNNISQLWFVMMSKQILFSSIIFIIIWLLSYALKRKSIWLHFLLWSIVLIRLIIPTDFSVKYSMGYFIHGQLINKNLPYISSFYNKQNQLTNNNAAENMMPVNNSNNKNKESLSNTNRLIQNPGIPFKSLKTFLPILLFFLWISGALTVLIFILRKQFIFIKSHKLAQFITDKKILTILTSWRLQLKIKRKIQLLSTNNINSPFVRGIIKPKIYIPRHYLSKFSTDALESIIIHELVHVKRFDCLFSFIQKFILILYYFHPVVWITNSKINALREETCDHITLRLSKMNPMIYCKIMLNIIDTTLLFKREKIIPYLTFGNGKKKYMIRIKKILKPSFLLSRLSWSHAIIVGFIGLFILPFGVGDNKNDNNKLKSNQILTEMENDSMKSRILKDVPPLLSGGGIKPEIPSRESYLFGALESVLKYLNEPVDYEYLMGTSGAAFRILVYNRCISACAPDVGCDYYIDLALPAVGYRKKHFCEGCFGARWDNQQETIEEIKNSIDNGVPVLSFNTFPFWGVIIGYKNDKFIVNTFFNETMIKKVNYGALIILEKSEPLPDKTEQIKKSFHTIVNHSKRRDLIGYKNSFWAYDEWIRQLKTPLNQIVRKNSIVTVVNKITGAMKKPLSAIIPERFMDLQTPEHEYQHANAWTYFNLIDARRAAKNYLLQAKEVFSGEKKKIAQDIYVQYDMIYKELKKNWVYFPMNDWIHADKNEIWSPTGTLEGTKWTDEMRLKGAESLERVKEMEEKAYYLMEQLVI